MPRYFFNVHLGDTIEQDTVGVELPSLEEAIADAWRARAEIMTEDELDSSGLRSWTKSEASSLRFARPSRQLVASQGVPCRSPLLAVGRLENLRCFGRDGQARFAIGLQMQISSCNRSDRTNRTQSATFLTRKRYGPRGYSEGTRSMRSVGGRASICARVWLLSTPRLGACASSCPRKEPKEPLQLVVPQALY